MKISLNRSKIRFKIKAIRMKFNQKMTLLNLKLFFKQHKKIKFTAPLFFTKSDPLFSSMTLSIPKHSDLVLSISKIFLPFFLHHFIPKHQEINSQPLLLLWPPSKAPMLYFFLWANQLNKHLCFGWSISLLSYSLLSFLALYLFFRTN